MAEGIPGDEVLATETAINPKCTMQFAQNAVINARFLFGQAGIGQFTAVNVLNQKETEMMKEEDPIAGILTDRVLKRDGHKLHLLAIAAK